MAAQRTKSRSLELEDTNDAPPTLNLLLEIFLTPLRIATSPTALRTYARTALLIIAAGLLYLVAIVAYIIFYNAYVPDASFFVPVHLQFDHLVHGVALDPAVYHPYATADIASSSLRRRRSRRWLPGTESEFTRNSVRGDPPTKPTRMITGLEYDIDVVMSMPRTPKNLAAGNFMLELSMLGPLPTGAARATSTTPLLGSASSFATVNKDEQAAVLAYSSRPATLTYTSALLAHSAHIFTMPLYLFNLRSETETLRVPMLERVAFPRPATASAAATTVPDHIRLEVRSRERLQVYAVTVEVRARFAGVRWLMSRHRILSFLLFTGAFWAGEMALALLVWGGAALALSSQSSSLSSSVRRPGVGAGAGGQVTSSEDEEKRRGRTGGGVKREDAEHEAPDLSDTERSFPTYSRQPALRYSSPRVKREDEDDTLAAAGDVRAAMTAGGEAADDEDDEEDADFLVAEEEMLPGGASAGGEFHDSGLGTGIESSAGGMSATARRRKGNK